MMADTNATAATTNGTTSGSEAVPQWKKELLQRRKNLAKTIGAASVPVHDSASAVAAALTTPTTPKAAGPPFGGPSSPANSSSAGQKEPSGEATCSSPTSPVESPSSSDPPVASVDNPSNRDSPASPTAFGTPVFVGHSGNEPATQQVLVKSSAGRPTTHTAATRESVPPGVLHVATSAGEKQPLCTQSHSNDGTESTIGGSSSNSSSRVAAESSPGPVGKYAAAVAGTGISGSVVVECELARPAAAASAAAASGETNSYSSSGSESWKLKKNTSSASSSTVSPNGKMVAASAEEIIYEKNRFVGPVGATTTTAGVPGELDPSEELKYGPGIVSKLRCRYLSLALRQSANKQRPSLNSMRRATSLNNLLDEESEDLSERETSIEAKDHSQDKGGQHHYGKLGAREQLQNQLNLQQQLPPHQQKAKTPDEYISTFQKSVQNSYTRSGRQTEKKNEYNRYNKQRGADSLKRARSVEALVRYDHKAWERDIQKENLYSSNDSNVIILDEICASNGTTTPTQTIIGNNNNNANNIANNCQTVAMNKAAADLIVDCVTIEEKIINGREKGDPKPKRLTSFIDADERPPPDVVRQTMKIFEANANRRGRPVARTNGAAGEVAAKVASYKSIISQEKPPITHPKPPLSPKKPNIIPRSTSPKSTTNTANGLKDSNNKPPTLPKLDLNVIRTSLETTNNLKNSANTTPTSTPTPTQNNATSTPLSVRVEPPSTYRLKYESPALSPNNTSKVTTTTAATNRAESPRFSTTTAAALPASMQNNTNSTAHTFVDSPSIQALTSKLNCLNIATSTPTSTRSPTPSDTVAPQAPPRGVVALQYATSDEEDPDDPEDQQREYSINSDRGSDSQPDDLELEDSEDEPDTSKTVSRAAMDNIAKAGVTTQFRFNGGGQNKSHLPVGGGGAKLLATKLLNVDDHHSSNSSSTSSSPITVPAGVVTAKPPVPLSRESLTAANGLKSASSVTANNHSNSLNNHNSSNANTSVNSNGSKLVINETASAPPPPASSDVVKSLTAREIEKNQINLEKSVEESAPVVAVPVVVQSASEKVKNNNSGSDGSPQPSGGDFFMAKWGSPAPATAAVASPLVPLVKKKVKAPPPPLEANTMVFNFSDRKDVPDYIENDGIILRPRPRELPKPGESGFVVLGDLTLETSTDPDDSWAMGPPSPCDVEFANANIVINGKSSMRNKTSRDSKFKIQFDDSLTSTFEYPSETSLLETNGFEPAADRTTLDGVDAAAANNNGQPPSSGGGGGGGGVGAPFADNGLLSHKNTLLSSMPLGSAPFASYTPVKAAIDTTFELGVTRTPSPSASSNSSTLSNEAPALPPPHHHHSNGATTTNGMSPQQQRFNGISNGGQQQDSGEPESIQYLKPASDEQTVNWSQGTRVTDLLF